MTLPFRKAFPLFLVLGAAALATQGCPETLQLSCPSGTATVGGFQLNFTPAPDAGDTCVVTALPDGGPTTAVVAAGPGSTQATLCSSSVDGGLIFLAIPGQNLRQSPIDGGGGFSFSSSALQVQGTQCVCTLDIVETFSGTLHPKGDAGAVQFTGDGGLTPVGSIDGTLLDQISLSDGGDAGGVVCRCGLPCALRYSAAGTPL